MKQRGNARECAGAVEPLERRALLSGQAPVAVNDSFSVLEDHELQIDPGLSSLSLTSNDPTIGTHTYTRSDGQLGIAGPDPEAANAFFDPNGGGFEIDVNFEAPS